MKMSATTTVSGSPRGSRVNWARTYSFRRHLACRAQHRAHDAVMRAAAAEVSIERFLHLGARRRRVLVQQRRRAHQDARHAIAALRRLFGDESALQRMRSLAVAQTLDRCNVLVRDRPQWRVARRHRAVADDDVAGAAFAGAAAEMRPSQAERTAQDVEQGSVGIGIDGGLDAIEAKSNARHRENPIAVYRL